MDLSKASKLLLAALPLTLIMGCSHRAVFKPVNAANGSPLADVHVEMIKVHFGFPAASKVSRRELPPTSDGLYSISISRLGSYNFVFDRPGFSTALVYIAGQKGYVESPYNLKEGETVSRTSERLQFPLTVPLHFKTAE